MTISGVYKVSPLFAVPDREFSCNVPNLLLCKQEDTQHHQHFSPHSLAILGPGLSRWKWGSMMRMVVLFHWNHWGICIDMYIYTFILGSSHVNPKLYEKYPGQDFVRILSCFADGRNLNRKSWYRSYMDHVSHSSIAVSCTPLKIAILNRKYIFKGSFFHCHVSFQGGNLKKRKTCI